MSVANETRVDRRTFVAALMQQVPEALVITGLGSPSYDAFAAGDRPANFYLWGAMGGAAAMGLGLALAQPERSVLVITGDGEQMMGVGALATIAVKQPRNLTIAVLDNGYFGETGMQRSHTGHGADLAAVARGFGIGDAFRVDALSGAAEIAQRVVSRAGPALAQVLIGADSPARAMPPRDGVFLKNRFRAALGLAPF